MQPYQEASEETRRQRELPGRVLGSVGKGAAYAAGLAVGFWANTDELRGLWQEEKRWLPQIDDSERAKLLRVWNKAVEKSLNWIDEDSIQL